MTALDRARVALAAHEAAAAMHRDAGDGRALRAALARVNGLRAKVAKLAAEARRFAELEAWRRAGAARQ